MKIGCSSDPIRCRASLKSGSSCKVILLGTIPGGLEHEGELHRRFAHYRLHEEWVNDASLPEVRGIIAQAAANPAPVTTNVIVAGDSQRDFLRSTDSQQMMAMPKLFKRLSRGCQVTPQKRRIADIRPRTIIDEWDI